MVRALCYTCGLAAMCKHQQSHGSHAVLTKCQFSERPSVISLFQEEPPEAEAAILGREAGPSKFVLDNTLRERRHHCNQAIPSARS